MFAIIHDLSSLSEDQRKQYCRDYAGYLGLNPDENRIDTIWMNSDVGRHLVAYCRRGTTDILRAVHNIDVVSLVREDGPNYVSYQASGINARGRKEIAVGAYTTLGLTGDRLAAAVATAQTRAVRRLTLQFVGGGLLDETEVNSQPVDMTGLQAAVPAAQPQTKPNTEVGKLTGYMNDKLKEDRIAPDTKPDIKAPKPAANLVPAQITTPEPEPAIKPAIPASVEAANAILAAQTTEDPSAPVKKPRKPRGPNKSKNTVELGDAPKLPPPAEDINNVGMAWPEKPTDKSIDKLTYVPICPVCNKFMAADDRLNLFLCVQDGRIDTTMKPSMLKAATPPIPEPAPIPVIPTPPPPKAASLLTDPEQKQVKARLAPCWVDILPKGGMTADDGISIWGKLIKFANGFYAEQPDYKKWTFAAWEVFFDFLDEFNGKNGATALVQHINGKINAA